MARARGKPRGRASCYYACSSDCLHGRRAAKIAGGLSSCWSGVGFCRSSDFERCRREFGYAPLLQDKEEKRVANAREPAVLGPSQARSGLVLHGPHRPGTCLEPAGRHGVASLSYGLPGTSKGPSAHMVHLFVIGLVARLFGLGLVAASRPDRAIEGSGGQEIRFSLGGWAPLGKR